MDKPTFDTMKKGYNRYQVDDYIQSMQLQLSSLQEKIEKAYQLRDSYEQEANDYKKLYDGICENLNVKEKAAFDMTRMAMKEANLIVETAHKNADVIVRESLMMAREVLSEIARVGKEANILKGNMKEDLAKISQALDEFETPQIPDMDLLKKEK
ncbi:DivIVA domain-containing protein [Amedibacillus sp. YH-ame10]